ncbi:hypothetical protein BD289DRAFT_150171 [Coniella lustricola]|uniref:Uncharacterized protein n=1 Tax=Coniella lustricola TaxID=2025994 RepID=A0A2T3AER6_9PEZI|nr:hypothetical protein BD289DRAFT_150171 [Coniella lustricola]
MGVRAILSRRCCGRKRLFVSSSIVSGRVEAFGIVSFERRIDWIRRCLTLAEMIGLRWRRGWSLALARQREKGGLKAAESSLCRVRLRRRKRHKCTAAQRASGNKSMSSLKQWVSWWRHDGRTRQGRAKRSEADASEVEWKRRSNDALFLVLRLFGRACSHKTPASRPFAIFSSLRRCAGRKL